MLTLPTQRHYLKQFLTLLLLAATLLLPVACDEGNDRVGWVGSSLPGEIAYRYQTFNGIETGRANVERGDTIDLTYQAEVTKGTLTIQLQAPDESIVWEETLREKSEGSANWIADQNGIYHVRIQGHQTGGSFEVRWSVN
jgi:hypothetical protein